MSGIPKYRTRAEAMVDFEAGRCPRWVYVDGWQVDLLAPEGNRTEEPPAEAATTQPAREGNRTEESTVNETMTETTEPSTGAQRAFQPDNVQSLSPLVEAALRCLAEAMIDRGGSPAEIRIVDRRSRYTVSHDLRVGIDYVKVAVGPYSPPHERSHLHVVTRRPSGATGPTEIVAVCETTAAAWALVDEIAADRTPSGRHPMWHAQAVAYPVRR